MKYIKTYETFDEDFEFIYDELVKNYIKENKPIPSREEVSASLKKIYKEERAETKYKVRVIDPSDIIEKIDEFKDIKNVKFYHGRTKFGKESYWAISPNFKSYGFTLSKDELKKWGQPIDINLISTGIYGATNKYNL